jgi:hypothetical protein
MLSNFILTVLVIASLVSLFGRSCEIYAEQKERKRTEKLYRKRYGRTY